MSNEHITQGNEFWRDPQMDLIIKTIIDIFVNTEGVELVRLNGLTAYLNKISGKLISKEDVQIIINKLNFANIINYKYELHCQHCGEISYIIIEKSKDTKLCDTCNLIYQIIPNKTCFVNIKEE